MCFNCMHFRKLIGSYNFNMADLTILPDSKLRFFSNYRESHLKQCITGGILKSTAGIGLRL